MPHAIIIPCIVNEPIGGIRPHGGELQGTFLDLVRQVEPTLSEELHDKDRIRGYTLALLDVWAGRRTLRELIIRLACLDDRIYPAISRWALGAYRGTPTVQLGQIQCQVSRILVTAQSGEPWAGYATYEELVQKASDRETVIRLEFATPTCFGQGARDEPLPLPRHVFGSLARRWNAAFPGRLQISIESPGESEAADGFLKLVEERVVLAHPFEFRSAVADLGDGLRLTGFVGRASYRITGKPAPELIRSLNLLADAAFFMGLGKKTSRGCGTVRRLKE